MKKLLLCAVSMLRKLMHSTPLKASPAARMLCAHSSTCDGYQHNGTSSDIVLPWNHRWHSFHMIDCNHANILRASLCHCQRLCAQCKSLDF